MDKYHIIKQWNISGKERDVIPINEGGMSAKSFKDAFLRLGEMIGAEMISNLAFCYDNATGLRNRTARYRFADGGEIGVTMDRIRETREVKKKWKTSIHDQNRFGTDEWHKLKDGK